MIIVIPVDFINPAPFEDYRLNLKALKALGCTFLALPEQEEVGQEELQRGIMADGLIVNMLRAGAGMKKTFNDFAAEPDAAQKYKEYLEPIKGEFAFTFVLQQFNVSEDALFERLLFQDAVLALRRIWGHALEAGLEVFPIHGGEQDNEALALGMAGSLENLDSLNDNHVVGFVPIGRSPVIIEALRQNRCNFLVACSQKYVGKFNEEKVAAPLLIGRDTADDPRHFMRHLPSLCIAPGTELVIQGLQKRPGLNGQVAKFIRVNSYNGRAVVSLAGQQKPFAIRATNLCHTGCEHAAGPGEPAAGPGGGGGVAAAVRASAVGVLATGANADDAAAADGAAAKVEEPGGLNL